MTIVLRYRREFLFEMIKLLVITGLFLSNLYAVFGGWLTVLLFGELGCRHFGQHCVSSGAVLGGSLWRQAGAETVFQFLVENNQIYVKSLQKRLSLKIIYL